MFATRVEVSIQCFWVWGKFHKKFVDSVNESNYYYEKFMILWNYIRSNNYQSFSTEMHPDNSVSTIGSGILKTFSNYCNPVYEKN